MKNSWYQCRECGLLMQKDSTPTVFGCKNNKNHSWINMGEVGNITYHCNKCGKTIQTKESPTVFGCDNGKNHSWYRM